MNFAAFGICLGQLSECNMRTSAIKTWRISEMFIPDRKAYLTLSLLMAT